jgi:peptidoglycan/LPS O-acetylase OafA/YrhL
LWKTTGYPHNQITELLGSYSYFGVQVFFVISGFLITSLLMDEQVANEGVKHFV